MSGILQALAGAASTVGAAPLALSFVWDGAVPLNMTSVSGSSSGINRFHHIPSGGTPPYTESWTITANPSGKLTLFPLGTQIGVAWNDMAINESESITVRYDVTDSAGASRAASASATIKRIS